MSFQQGLSGLNASAQSLDVIGNNIANSSTVGFKSSTVEFADLYASSLNGGGGNQAGIGVQVAQISQQFSQGGIETTTNPLDIAINGGGFFRTVTNGAVEYTRNGQFSLDKSGYVVNAEGAQLTGYPANGSGQILAGSPVPLQIANVDLSPVATTQVATALNLDSTSVAPKTGLFNANDPTSYNEQSSTDVFDSLGGAHMMSTYYVATATPGTWNVYTAVDGAEVAAAKVAAAVQADAPSVASRATYLAAQGAGAGAAALAVDATAYALAASTAASAASPGNAAAITAAANTPAALAAGPAGIDAAIAAAVPAVATGTLTFNTNGTLSGATSLPITLPIAVSSGANTPLSLTMSFAGSTQYGAATSINSTTQNGYTAGSLTSFSAGANGVIQGQYSNGQSQALGQIVLANFTNPGGLSVLGNNAFVETAASGTPQVGEPSTGSLGALQSSAVESSTVDLTTELVNLIVAQRAYQANAQTIKTQDQVLQTLVNLQ